ncbi:MAG: hypothetical protein ACLP01_29765 [Solirubrobacteraceae bacterium]
MILNIDENRLQTAHGLAEFVPHLVVTHAQAPFDNLERYRLLGGIYGRRSLPGRRAGGIRGRGRSGPARQRALHFRERHLAEVAASVQAAQISLIDGEMPSSCGSRADPGPPLSRRPSPAAAE